MLADDKLREAKFFLRKMKRCKKGSEFRYFLSAFLSAARSVTFVLQKDFRHKQGEKFDKWYKEQESKIASNETATLVVLCRNVVLKEGPRLPIYTVRVQNPEYPGEYLEFVYSIRDIKEKRLKIKYSFKLDEDELILDENRPIEEQVEEKIHKKFPHLIQSMRDLTARMYSEIKPEKFISFSEEEAPRTLSIWFKELERYLDLLAEIVAEAKSVFRS